MKNKIAVLISLALAVLFLAGCAAGSPAAPESAAESPAADSTEIEPAEAETAQKTAEPVPTDTEEVPEQAAQIRGHYSFQPKVCSSYMTELFGEPMRDTWFALVDALLAGEDHFSCPDEHTYWWVMGQFPDQCFPVLQELIGYTYDVDHPVVDGMGSFTYLVPREEAAARIAEFAALVEEILNSTLADDYSDLEKALALYLYFSNNYVYDYVAAAPDANPDYLSSYRVLTTGTGICQEFSVAYSYLLLQAGVDASNMSGHRSYDGMLHQWSYVKINGRNFHIDPTYVIGSCDSLSYFMMDDDQREAEDGYCRDNFVICSNYAQDNPHPDYRADDDSFRAIWAGSFAGFDHETRTLYYESYGEAESTMQCFDYTGW